MLIMLCVLCKVLQKPSFHLCAETIHVFSEFARLHWQIYELCDGCVPPPQPKFLHFHAVFGKNWSNSILASPSRVGTPLREIMDPPLVCGVIFADFNSQFQSQKQQLNVTKTHNVLNLLFNSTALNLTE